MRANLPILAELFGLISLANAIGFWRGPKQEENVLKGKVRIQTISKEGAHRILRLVPREDDTITIESRLWGRELPEGFELNLIASPEVDSLVQGGEYYLQLVSAQKGATA